MDEIVGEQIRIARRRLRYSQEALANMLGVERLQITRWENNKQRPRPEMLERLMEALGRPREWFLGHSERGGQHLSLEERVDLLDQKLDRILQILEEGRPETSVDEVQSFDALGRPFPPAARSEGKRPRKPPGWS